MEEDSLERRVTKTFIDRSSKFSDLVKAFEMADINLSFSIRQLYAISKRVYEIARGDKFDKEPNLIYFLHRGYEMAFIGTLKAPLYFSGRVPYPHGIGKTELQHINAFMFETAGHCAMRAYGKFVEAGRSKEGRKKWLPHWMINMETAANLYSEIESNRAASPNFYAGEAAFILFSHGNETYRETATVRYGKFVRLAENSEDYAVKKQVKLARQHLEELRTEPQPITSIQPHNKQVCQV